MSRWDRYVGIPYVDRGRDAAVGLDCWGLVREVYRQELAVDLPSYHTKASAGTDPAGVPALVQHEALLHWEAVLEPLPLDVVVVRVQKQPFHVGIVLDDPRFFLHTVAHGIGSSIERLDGLMWARRIEGYYRCTIRPT